MDRKKHLQNFLEGNDLRIKRELHDFSVAGGALADLIVGRILYETTTVSRHHFVYTFAFQIDRLQTPETATTEGGELLTIVWARLQRFFVHKECPLLLSFADKRTAQQNQPVPTLPPTLKDAMAVIQEKKQRMANRLPKALLLDLDDTILADSDPGDDCWLAAYQPLVDQLAVISYQQFLAAIHERRNWSWSDFDRGRRGRLDLSIARRHIAADTLQQLGIADPLLAHEMERVYSAQREQRSHLFPGAIETLQWLRDQGVPLALLTNGAAKVQRKKIERWGLASFLVVFSNC
jgi:phosphoserine phosphatase